MYIHMVMKKKTDIARSSAERDLTISTANFEQRNGLISDSSNILTPSSRYTRHNPHPRPS